MVFKVGVLEGFPGDPQQKQDYFIFTIQSVINTCMPTCMSWCSYTFCVINIRWGSGTKPYEMRICGLVCIS